jgi:hypothetical protein
MPLENRINDCESFVLVIVEKLGHMRRTQKSTFYGEPLEGIEMPDSSKSLRKCIRRLGCP